MKNTPTGISRHSTNAKNILRNDFRCYVTQSSQLEYDNRKNVKSGAPGGAPGATPERTFNTDNVPNLENVRRILSEAEAGAVFGEKESLEDRTKRENTPLKIEGRELVVTMVCNKARAKEVLKIMYEQQKRNPKTVWACDTEVMDIDLKLVGEKLLIGVF